MCVLHMFMDFGAPNLTDAEYKAYRQQRQLDRLAQVADIGMELLGFIHTQALREAGHSHGDAERVARGYAAIARSVRLTTILERRIAGDQPDPALRASVPAEYTHAQPQPTQPPPDQDVTNQDIPHQDVPDEDIPHQDVPDPANPDSANPDPANSDQNQASRPPAPGPETDSPDIEAEGTDGESEWDAEQDPDPTTEAAIRMAMDAATPPARQWTSRTIERERIILRRAVEPAIDARAGNTDQLAELEESLDTLLNAPVFIPRITDFERADNVALLYDTLGLTPQPQPAPRPPPHPPPQPSQPV